MAAPTADSGIGQSRQPKQTAATAPPPLMPSATSGGNNRHHPPPLPPPAARTTSNGGSLARWPPPPPRPCRGRPLPTAGRSSLQSRCRPRPPPRLLSPSTAQDSGRQHPTGLAADGRRHDQRPQLPPHQHPCRPPARPGAAAANSDGRHHPHPALVATGRAHSRQGHMQWPTAATTPPAFAGASRPYSRQQPEANTDCRAHPLILAANCRRQDGEAQTPACQRCIRPPIRPAEAATKPNGRHHPTAHVTAVPPTAGSDNGLARWPPPPPRPCRQRPPP